MTKSVTERDMVSRGRGDAEIGVGLVKNRNLVCFKFFDPGRSREIRWIAMQWVILLIGRHFFRFAQNDILASSTLI